VSRINERKVRGKEALRGERRVPDAAPPFGRGHPLLPRHLPKSMHSLPLMVLLDFNMDQFNGEDQLVEVEVAPHTKMVGQRFPVDRLFGPDLNAPSGHVLRMRNVID